ncbi:MAG: tRNA uridine-5-carboxymethylaminomethyl(34) synthesis GTPase MnmE [Kordiimonadaceae bacterium]|nr:tRNA uridine-5-carboxymethylaminomethyl(34) synthesis GTPase MnmE [Kordiimonadaceae bacterium]
MTIFALSSGKGRAGIGVIRVSGPQTKNAVFALTKKNISLNPREMTLNWFYDPDTNEKLDRGMVVFFPGPCSFTGEDVAEFHIHGGYAVVGGVMEALSKLPNLRSAEAGEFTRRAFDNDKMDLTAVEGLADLINAETQSQKKQALRQMDGELGDIYKSWRHQLITAMAYLEVSIDFSEEEVPDDVTSWVTPIIKKLKGDITKHLADGHRGERLRHGLQVVILGAPNAGKSTLLNFLSQRDVAIVSDIAGTTRDILEVHLDLSGFPVSIVDTAGLRLTGDEIEIEGIRRAEQRARDADLKIVIIDVLEPSVPDKLALNHLGDNTLVLLNKCDLLANANHSLAPGASIGCWDVSLKDGLGMAPFMEALKAQVENRMELTETPSLTRTRHRASLRSAEGHLDRFMSAEHAEIELLSEDLRLAARDLGKITGDVDVEDILEKIFTEFCIGK